MKRSPLLVRNAHESGPDLLEPDLSLLLGRSSRLSDGCDVLRTASLSGMAAATIEKGVVQDLQQPAGQAPAGAEGGTCLVGADKGILHPVMGLGLVARQGSG